MKQNLKKLFRILAAIFIVVMMLSGCTKTDKKCMPLTSSSKKAIALAWEGQTILADGFNARAIELFKQALELDSNFVVANLWYDQNAGLGNIKRHEYFKRAERNIANVPEAEQHFIKSYLAYEKGDQENVIKELKAIVELYPEDKYMSRMLAVRYYAFGKYEDALEYAKKSYQTDTTFSTIVNYQGLILNAMGKREEAEEWYKKSIEINPEVPLYYNNYGQLLRAVGRIDEAIQMHKKAIGIQPDFLSNLYLSHCYLALGEYELARENYSKAFDLSANDVQKSTQLLFIACSYLFESKLNEAYDAFDKRSDFIRKTGNMDLELINNIANKGFCYLQFNDLVNAEKCFKEGTELISSAKMTDADRETYKKYSIFWRGWLEAINGKVIEAQKSMEEFKNSMKDEAELDAMKFYWNSFQGIVAYSKKNWTDAVSFLTLANNAITSYYAGLAYQSAGEKEKAKEVFTKIAGANLVGLPSALVKPLAKNKLAELTTE